MGLTEHTSMEPCFWSKQSYVEILSYYKITSWRKFLTYNLEILNYFWGSLSFSGRQVNNR